MIFIILTIIKVLFEITFILIRTLATNLNTKERKEKGDINDKTN